jgi:diguanylate cyclase (GGDEF)-like protein/PAS domain S-box-containing protein
MHSDISMRNYAQKHVEQMEGKYRGLLEAAPDAMVVVNQNGEIVLLNMQAEKQFGYQRDELLGQQVTSIIPVGFAERLIADDLRSAAEALAQQIGTGIELVARRKDGSEFPIEIMLSPLESAEGILVTTAIRDISVRKTVENRIRRLNRIYAVLSNINSLIVRVRDRDVLFREACRIAVDHGKFRFAWIGLLDANGVDVTPLTSAGIEEGYLDNIRLTALENVPDSCTLLSQALQKKTLVVCNDIDTDPRMARWRVEALRRGYRSVVVFPLLLADKVLGVLLLYASEKDFFDTEEMKLLTELAGDIAFAIDHIDKQEQIDYLAYYDVLTGLANHKLLLDRVAQYIRIAVSHRHKLALCLIDIKRFKNINDSFGQPAGDALLKQVAEWLTQNMEDTNLLARIGADHFTVILPVVRRESDVARKVEKMLKALLEYPFSLNGEVFHVAARAGVALLPDDGADAITLLQNAESALKKTKVSGDQYLFYTQKMSEMVALKLTMENQLHQALKNEEFVLYYQPKCNVATNKLTSVEVLIRWNNPRTGGLVPPMQFIPILEETGLIHEVGHWALHKAVEDYLRWRTASLPAIRVAVNVSALQLRNRNFINEIEQAIAIDEHAAAGLELEITESVIMEDIKYSIASLQAIRALGVTIAIDDFGTGYSSLRYLAKLPVDTLKIDRSFVNEMTASADGLALVSTIINLGHSLNIKIVAEGVETEEQLQLLRLLKCDEMQGFLFSKPVPVDIFETKFLIPHIDD